MGEGRCKNLILASGFGLDYNDGRDSVKWIFPEGAPNFAFLGQFAEAPKDCVFTVEYSVRTAQMAVYGLFDTVKEVHQMYDSAHNPKYLLGALKAINR